jgi:hypothetical protein
MQIGGSTLREKFGYTPLPWRPPSHLGYGAYHSGMHEIRPQRPVLRPSLQLVAVDVLLRREPDEDEEEDEDEDEGSRKEDEEDEADEGESDDGYSE